MTDLSDLAIVLEFEPKADDIRLLETSLYEFNVRNTGLSDGMDLALFLRNREGKVLGGIYGWTWGRTCYVRYLFVPAGLRAQGRGTGLMQAVEAEARARGCTQIVLETHDFQAPEFYGRLGFKVTGRVDGYPHGHAYLTMVKQLPSRDADQP